jgi:predicted small lipoprotein YifL
MRNHDRAQKPVFIFANLCSCQRGLVRFSPFGAFSAKLARRTGLVFGDDRLKFISVKDLGIVLCVAAALALSGCGRRGPLEPPPGVPESQAAPMINPTTSGTMDATNSVAAKESNSPVPDAGTPQPGVTSDTQPANTTAPVVKPKKPFLLDPVL